MGFRKLWSVSPKMKDMQEVSKRAKSALLLKRLEDLKLELIYIDELNFSERQYKAYGWRQKENKAWWSLVGGNFSFSMIFGLSSERYQPIIGVKGTFDSEAIIMYLKYIKLCQHTMNRNESDYAIVWDNASIHQSAKVMKFLVDSKIHMFTIPAHNPWLKLVEAMIGSF